MMANEHEASYYERKPYYVSVQAGSILEDPTVTSYELALTANEEELNRLQELIEEYSIDGRSPDGRLRDESFIVRYVSIRNERGHRRPARRYLPAALRAGNDETKHHVATMGLFPDGSLQ